MLPKGHMYYDLGFSKLSRGCEKLDFRDPTILLKYGRSPQGRGQSPRSRPIILASSAQTCIGSHLYYIVLPVWVKGLGSMVVERWPAGGRNHQPRPGGGQVSMTTLTASPRPTPSASPRNIAGELLPWLAVSLSRTERSGTT